MSRRQMRIGMSLRGHGYHLAAWRHPDVPADASVRIDHYVRTAYEGTTLRENLGLPPAVGRYANASAPIRTRQRDAASQSPVSHG